MARNLIRKATGANLDGSFFNNRGRGFEYGKTIDSERYPIRISIDSKFLHHPLFVALKERVTAVCGAMFDSRRSRKERKVKHQFLLGRFERERLIGYLSMNQVTPKWLWVIPFCGPKL